MTQDLGRNEATENAEQDGTTTKRRRRWRTLVMLLTMGYVFPHALME